MRKAKFFLILLILPAIGITGLSAVSKVKNPSLNIIRLTDNSSGKIITIHKGFKILLELTNQPDGGYILDSIKYNKLILRLIKHTQKSPAANSTLGHPGRAIWEFLALKPGTCIIKVTASRPWNKIDFITIYSSILKIKR